MLAPDLHRSGSKQPITLQKLLIVEGPDAFQFFKALLRKIALLESIEIRTFGGVNELPDYLNNLPAMSGFRLVTSFGIVRDAETDAFSAFDSVCGALRQARLPVPKKPAVPIHGQPSVAVFILPDCREPGMLETLCLQATADDPAMACVKEYFDCLTRKDVDFPANRPKAETQTFLASRPEPGNLLGQAAHAGYWNFKSPVYDPLKQFLRNL